MKDVPEDQLTALYEEQEERVRQHQEGLKEGSTRIEIAVKKELLFQSGKIRRGEIGSADSDNGDSVSPTPDLRPAAESEWQPQQKSDFAVVNITDSDITALIKRARLNTLNHKFDDEEIAFVKKVLLKIENTSNLQIDNIEKVSEIIAVLNIYLGLSAIDQVCASVDRGSFKADIKRFDFLLFGCSCLSKAEIEISKVFNKQNYPRLFSKKNPYRNRGRVDSLSIKGDLENIRKGLQTAFAKFLLVYSELISSKLIVNGRENLIYIGLERDTSAKEEFNKTINEISNEAIEVAGMIQRKIEKLERFISSVQISPELLRIRKKTAKIG